MKKIEWIERPGGVWYDGPLPDYINNLLKLRYMYMIDINYIEAEKRFRAMVEKMENSDRAKESEKPRVTDYFIDDTTPSHIERVINNEDTTDDTLTLRCGCELSILKNEYKLLQQNNCHIDHSTFLHLLQQTI